LNGFFLFLNRLTRRSGEEDDGHDEQGSDQRISTGISEHVFTPELCLSREMRGLFSQL
jgi:hypothetical protein